HESHLGRDYQIVGTICRAVKISHPPNRASSTRSALNMRDGIDPPLFLLPDITSPLDLPGQHFPDLHPATLAPPRRRPDHGTRAFSDCRARGVLEHGPSPCY